MKISELEMKMIAKEASSNYLNDGASLNDQIVKLAKERDLNPHQVARICEQANLNTYHTLWDKTGSGDFVFDLADQEKIADALSASVSPLMDEFTADVGSIKDLIPQDPIIAKDAPTKAEKSAAFSKLAAAAQIHMSKEQEMAKLIKLASRLKYYMSEIDGAIFEAKVMAKEAEAKMHEMCKIAALRDQNLAEIYTAVIRTRPEKLAQAKPIFERIFESLKKNGIDFSKHAAVFSESSRGEKHENMPVVNKNHALLKHLDTVLDLEDQLCKSDSMRDFVVRKLEVLTDRINQHKGDE